MHRDAHMHTWVIERMVDWKTPVNRGDLRAGNLMGSPKGKYIQAGEAACFTWVLTEIISQNCLNLL